ncbi:MAG: pentatricopeptide repeat protein [Arenicella sp.]|jgi:pentatricopeptide repeat protein
MGLAIKWRKVEASCHIKEKHNMKQSQIILFIFVGAFLLNSLAVAQEKINPKFSADKSTISQSGERFSIDYVDSTTLKFLHTVVNNKADLINNSGVEAFRARNYALAIREFKNAIAVRSNFMEAKLNLASAYIAQKSYDKALEVYNAMQKESESPAEVWVLKGQVELARGKFKEAISNFDQATKIDESNPQTLHAIGNAYLQSDDLEKAIENYSKAIEMKKVSAFYTDRASAYLKQTEYRKAIGDYDKAISLDKNNARAFTNRGKAHFELQEYPKALADFDKAIELDGNYILALINRAATKNFTKDFGGALEDCNLALKIDSKHPLALLNRGIVKSRLGDSAGACTDWKRAKTYGNKEATDYLTKFCK